MIDLLVNADSAGTSQPISTVLGTAAGPAAFTRRDTLRLLGAGGAAVAVAAIDQPVAALTEHRRSGRDEAGRAAFGPEGVYVLDWEDPAHCAFPKPPPRWTAEFDPDVRHDGEPQVRCALAPEPVRAGQHAVRFELRKGDPVIHNGTRAELAGWYEPLGAERWYGFSIYLPHTWELDRSAESVTQWHQHYEVGSSPSLAIVTRSGQWGIVQSWDGNPNGTLSMIEGRYEIGQWTDWVVHVKWSGGDDGLLEIWKNGRPVPDFSPRMGVNSYSDSRGNYMKIGIYKWDWGQGKPSDTQARVLYHDEVRIADERGSYDVVAPPGRAAGLALAKPLSLSPASPVVGRWATARFAVKNTGGQLLTVPVLVAGTRDPAQQNRDFPAVEQVRLGPGEVYEYAQRRRFRRAGAYVAWPATLLDGDWVELGPRHEFRVRPQRARRAGRHDG